MLSVHVLPALHGDAIWLEYGDRRILIDGGPRSGLTTGLIREFLTEDPSAVELIIISHIDADHITGVLEVFRDKRMALRPGDVWFNGWKHLPDDFLGPEQGEALGRAIEERSLPWNLAFAGGPVEAPELGQLPRVELPGGLALTVLSPTRTELAALRPVWKREVERAGLVRGAPAELTPPADLLGESDLDLSRLMDQPFREDRSEANGASIAVLAECESGVLLLTGDAHPSILTKQLRRLALEREVDRIRVDVVKLPHHGSGRNVSRDLVEAIACERWLFSTNGSIFGHPDPVAVARLVVDRPGQELIFNYRAQTTSQFDSSGLKRKHGYRTLYPESEAGIRIDIPG